MTFEIMAELRDKSPDALADNSLPEELRGMRPEEMERFAEVLEAHLRTIHQDENTGELRDKTPAEQKAFDYGLRLRDIAIAKIEEHRAVQEVFRRRPKAVEAAMFNLSNLGRNRGDAFGDVRRLTASEVRDGALRTLEDRRSSSHLTADERDQLDRQIRRNTDLARRVLVTETDAYRNAWMKMVTDPNGAMLLEDEERMAMRAYAEYRAASETNASGGFAVPVKLAA